MNQPEQTRNQRFIFQIENIRSLRLFFFYNEKHIIQNIDTFISSIEV